MNKVHLKIKIKSLAAEAQIIRREEQIWKARKERVEHRIITSDDETSYIEWHPTYSSLRGHRVGTVREEARSALLAYGYLRGRTYRQIERFCYEPPNWQRIAQLAGKPTGEILTWTE